MRNRFPALWILQLLLLLGTGLGEMFAPRWMLEGYLGVQAPADEPWPDPELATWALHLEEISPPPEAVVLFFTQHQLADPEARQWSANDPGSKVIGTSGATRWQETIDWILSASPPLPAEQHAKVHTWLKAVDQALIPGPELVEWIREAREVSRPPPDLLVWIGGMDQVDDITWRLATDSVRQESPYILAAALFTLFGLLNPLIRTALARIFTLVFVLWTVPVVYGHQPDIASELLLSTLEDGTVAPQALAAAEAHGGQSILQARQLWIWLGLLSAVTLAFTFVRSAGRVTSVILYLFLIAWCVGIAWLAPTMPPLADVSLYGFLTLTLINGYYWLAVKSEAPPQDDAGIAEGRPPQLWTLWFVQFAFLLTVGVCTLVVPGRVLEFFTLEQFDYLATKMAEDQLRFSGTWIIAMALFSYVALGAADDRTWRAFGGIFIASFLLFAFANLLNISSGEYSIWAYAFSFQGVFFVPVTYRLLRHSESPWSRENVERESDHATPMELWAVARMTPWFSGRRVAFQHGIGVAGELTVLPQAQDLPANEFFEAGSHFGVHARFSNRAHGDDAALDIRGATLKLYDPIGLPLLDLPFATGSFALVSNIFDFLKVIPKPVRDGALGTTRRRLRRLLRSDRKVFEGFAAGLRRAPSSFLSLTYDHQITRHWTTPDCEEWLCRLRLRPTAEVAPSEIGAPDAADLEALWSQGRREGEQRSTRYLRDELAARFLAGEHPELLLEVQLHRLLPGDSLEWYDGTVEWREQEHPWRPLARLQLHSVLTEDEAAGLRFDPSRSPRSIAIPKSTDYLDVRSLGAGQARVMRLVGKARTWRRPGPKSFQAPRLEKDDPTRDSAPSSKQHDGA